jgi:hypothetical protein
VNVGGAGTYLDEVQVLGGGTLVASTVTSKPVIALWEDTGVQLFQFKLKATDESFTVTELGFGVNDAYMSNIYVYQDATLVGSESVDGTTATVSTNFTLTGEKVFTVKADFIKQDTVNGGSFIPKLIAVNATGVGSDEDTTWTGSVAGKTVYVYPSVVSVSSSMANGTFTPSVNKKVFAFDVIANGGDVKLASGSFLANLNIETVGMPAVTTWELRKDSTVVASGSYSGGILPISLDEQADDIILTDGDSASFTLYMNTVAFTGTNRYVGTSIENLDGAIKWLGQDVDGEWLATQFVSVKDIIVGLPTVVTELTE